MSSATDGKVNAAICHTAGDNYAVDGVYDVAYHCQRINDRDACIAVSVLFCVGHVYAMMVNNVNVRTYGVGQGVAVKNGLVRYRVYE